MLLTTILLFRFCEQSSSMHLVGQEVGRRGDVQIENAIIFPYSGDRQLRKRSSHRLAGGVSSQVVCSEFISDQLALLGTSDGTIFLMDIVQHRLECQTKCVFIPSNIRIHPDKSIFIALSADKALVQCFDIALNPIK